MFMKTCCPKSYELVNTSVVGLHPAGISLLAAKWGVVKLQYCNKEKWPDNAVRFHIIPHIHFSLPDTVWLFDTTDANVVMINYFRCVGGCSFTQNNIGQVFFLDPVQHLNSKLFGLLSVFRLQRIQEFDFIGIQTKPFMHHIITVERAIFSSSDTSRILWSFFWTAP